MKLIVSLCCVSALLGSIQTANILIYIPMPFFSHQNTFTPVWETLARRGHNIILMQSNVTVENNKNISYILLEDTYDVMNKDGFIDKMARGDSITGLLVAAIDALTALLDYQLNHPEFRKVLNREKNIDLVITEVLMLSGLAVAYDLKVPAIGISSMDAPVSIHFLLGNPTHPVVYPDINVDIPPEPSFKERGFSSISWLFSILADYWQMHPAQDRYFAKQFGEIPPVRELVKDLALLLINVNPIFGNVRPVGPKTINIGGGLNNAKPKPLPIEIQEFLDSAEHGAIFFSLGSNLNSKNLPEATKYVIVDTFARLGLKVLWKFDEKPDNITGNVKILPWVPQPDVLRHKNVKLFITHGGLQSMEEAIYNHVPMIALPFYGDQFVNVRKMVAMELGVSIDWTSLSVEKFQDTILSTIDNLRFVENARDLANAVLDQPMPAAEKAVWWIEYVLRHKNTDRFKNRMAVLPWYQFLFLDAIFVIMVGSLASFGLIYIIYKFISKLYGWKKARADKPLIPKEEERGRKKPKQN